MPIISRHFMPQRVPDVVDVWRLEAGGHVSAAAAAATTEAHIEQGLLAAWTHACLLADISKLITYAGGACTAPVGQQQAQRSGGSLLLH